MTNPLAARFSHGTALVKGDTGTLIETNLHFAWASLQASAEQRHLDIMASADDDFWSEDWSWVRPYSVVGGVLQIPIKGVLLSGFPYQLWDWATGYEYIQAAFQRGMDDPEVKGIAFIIDSPGGEVEGNFDLVDFMSGDAKAKPVQAFAVSAYSAAYSIASAADKITVTRTGGVGSIGVVTSHVDMSEALSQWGYKITFIFAGKHKVDGNQYEPLPDDVKQRIQATVDKLYGMFVGIVSRNRNMSEEAVRATEALTYISDSAVEIGLADAIGPLVDSLAAFSAELNMNGGTLMSTTAKTEATAETQAVDNTKAIDAARAEGVEQGKVAGRTEANERAKAILTAPEAKDRMASAMEMTFGTSLTAEQAVALLKTMPEASAKGEEKKKDNPFAAAMDQGGNPNINAGSEGQGEMSASDRILADFASAGGTVKKRA